jgi:hypothetical protein
MPLSLNLVLLISLGSTHCFASSGIEDMRSNDVMHGLYEIGEAARNFVVLENARTHGQWEAGDPNLKVFVPRCAVPLKAQWDTVRWTVLSGSGESLQRSRRVIAVTCSRTAGPPQKWEVLVPVDRRK